MLYTLGVYFRYIVKSLYRYVYTTSALKNKLTENWELYSKYRLEFCFKKLFVTYRFEKDKKLIYGICSSPFLIPISHSETSGRTGSPLHAYFCKT